MKKLEADIVVIGAGTAGLPAAITAAEGGAKVILCEKRGTSGGSANMANMVFAVESRLQRLKPPVLTKEEAFKAHMDWVHWRADGRLVKAFYDKSADTIDWLEKLGVEFEGVGTYSPGRYNTTHVVKAPDTVSRRNVRMTGGSAAFMMKILTRRARERGVQLFLKTPVKQIFKKRGRIAGVIAEDGSGEDIQADARAVIIGTGGFGNNPDMIKKYCGYQEGRDLFMIKVLGLKGDGIRMAWELGAAESEMQLALMHHLPPPCQGPGGTAPELRTFSQPTNIMVNLSGERFIPEDLRGGHQTVGNAISRQKDRAAFMIFDGDTKKYYDETGVEPPRPLGLLSRPRVFRYDNLDDNIKGLQDRGYKYLFMADSLEDLCAQTGIDQDGLQKTVDEYNRFCETGCDELFNKNPELLMPVKRPKFYAARFFLGAYGTVGGIKINYKTEVLTRDYKVIPGLYAAGSDANAIYGGTYVPLAGNYMGFAVNTGRIAAENALEYIKSIGK